MDHTFISDVGVLLVAVVALLGELRKWRKPPSDDQAR
jgi:hypothetical protein